tara:strand:- start:349 stop:1242 length:894 start_codon:yes stop_codon:yes gene_type:complete
LISESDILGSFQHLIENQFQSDLVLVGSGDDAAVIKKQDKNLVHSLDISKVNTHFPENSNPEDIAYRSIAVALSDLAAMGAYPSFITIGLTSDKKDIHWYKQFSNGVESIIEDYDIKLVGGDITYGELNICVNVFGYPFNEVLLRSKAKPNDLIYITGTLGKGRKGLSDWKNNKTSKFLSDYFRPKVHFKKSKYISNLASSCIDISDGLIKDLNRICKASNVGAIISSELIPTVNDIHDLSYGDDYELCFTCPEKYKKDLNQNDYIQIGVITNGSNVELLKENKVLDFNKKGWDSFS